MSQSAQFYIEQKKIRREQYLARLNINVQNFYKRYKNEYEKFIRLAYSKVIPHEVNKLKKDLYSIEKNIKENIELCDKISKEIGDYIYSFPNLAKEAKARIDEAERKRREQEIAKKKEAENKILIEVLSKINSIEDPIIRDFAYDYSIEIKNKVKNIKNVNTYNINQEFKILKEKAEKKASKWKKIQENKNKKEALKNKLSGQLEELKKEKSNDIKKITDKLSKIIITDDNIIEVENLIKIKTKKAEELIVDEKVRQKTVKAIYQILKKQGFIVQNPQINKETNIVTLSAKRPSGNTADYEIKLNGKFSYHLDGYKGMSCKKDIDKMKKEMEEIYGFKISEEKIGWQNPDMNYSDANSLPKSNKNKFNK